METGSPLLASQLNWSKAPNARDIANAYPDRANRQHLEGQGVARCFISAEWTLERCAVVSSEPPDSGFGDAVVYLAPRFKLSPSQTNPRATPGAEVLIPFEFRLH
jgi:hypothetical protein